MDDLKRTVFQAGWRPAIGWACAASFATLFVLQPVWLLLANGVQVQAETGPLVTVTTAILGIGGLRTYEKIKGVTK